MNEPSNNYEWQLTLIICLLFLISGILMKGFHLNPSDLWNW